MAAPLPEIPFADAEGDVRLVYDAIADALGVPLVNLVWRHLATRPGCLEWAWSVVAPRLQDGTFARHGRRLVEAVESGGTPVSLGDLGLGADDTARVLATLDAYNRANPVNITALQVLGIAVRNDRAAPRFRAPPPAAGGHEALLPITPLVGLPPATHDLLHRLAGQTVGGDAPMVPSLFRHFTAWPDLLAAFSDILATRDDGPEARAARIVDAAAESARKIFAGLPAPGPDAVRLEPALRKAVDATVGTFVPAICRMIPIGAVLRDGLRT